MLGNYAIPMGSVSMEDLNREARELGMRVKLLDAVQGVTVRVLVEERLGNEPIATIEGTMAQVLFWLQAARAGQRMQLWLDREGA